jgi:hypothetical protein
LELRVIEDVEEFGPELQIQGLRQLRVLQQCHIPVVYTWTMEEPAPRVAKLSNLFRTEWGRIEVLQAMFFSRIKNVNPTPAVVRYIYAKRDRTGKLRAQ